MKNLKILILGGLLTGSLVVPGTPAMADPPGLHKGWETHPGLHKGWEKNHHGWAKGDDGDDRYEEHYRHEHYRRPYNRYRDHYYPSTVRDRNRARAARQALAEDRLELNKNVQQLKKDKAELRKDIRRGASRKEIAQDHAAILQSRQKVADSMKDVRQSQRDVNLAR